QPRRIAAAEALLEGRTATAESIGEAAAAVSAAVDPLEDFHTSAGYRRDLIGTAVRRAFAQAGG
ncbi:MAG: xanthine dehydrogenase family protein subunit M, partial [Proteobacteria bacterium]|nr:xanthine dehydrogenase family protein subunit M [Pseudomonadota bacterium]